MARSIFIKYNLNDYQGKLLKNQNEPNPVFLQELAQFIIPFYLELRTSYRNIKCLKRFNACVV